MMRGLVRMTLAVAIGALSAAPAFAGNIALTGHDDDFHCGGSLLQASCSQLNNMVAFARAGSTTPTLPVLSFDQSTELTSDLTSFGITFTNISTVAGVTASLFDPTLYSAFVVASDSSCGGCDNSTSFEAAIAAQLTAITNFFNAGGGIVGLSGAGNAASYYNFVPQSASGSGSPPSSPYFPETCFGSVTVGAVNGDPTHNFFAEPGTGGVSSLYCVAERFGNALDGTPETLLLQGGTIVTDVITTTSTTTTGGAPVPEPATLTLLGVGLAGSAWRRRRRS